MGMRILWQTFLFGGNINTFVYPFSLKSLQKNIDMLSLKELNPYLELMNRKKLATLF